MGFTVFFLQTDWRKTLTPLRGVRCIRGRGYNIFYTPAQCHSLGWMTQNNRAEWWVFLSIPGKRKYLWCLKVSADLRRRGGRAGNAENVPPFQPQRHTFSMHNTCLSACTLQHPKGGGAGLRQMHSTIKYCCFTCRLCQAHSQSQNVPMKKGCWWPSSLFELLTLSLLSAPHSRSIGTCPNCARPLSLCVFTVIDTVGQFSESANGSNTQAT